MKALGLSVKHCRFAKVKVNPFSHDSHARLFKLANLGKAQEIQFSPLKKGDSYGQVERLGLKSGICPIKLFKVNILLFIFIVEID